MKNSIVLLLLVASGCATSRGGERREALCAVANPTWSSAERDWDRATTLEILASVRHAADDDRAHLRAGRLTDVGSGLDSIASQTAPRTFISHDVAELATRLRQLDCAVRAGRLAFEVADQHYAQILGELAVERAMLEPPAAAGASTADRQRATPSGS